MTDTSGNVRSKGSVAARLALVLCGALSGTSALVLLVVVYRRMRTHLWMLYQSTMLWLIILAVMFGVAAVGLSRGRYWGALVGMVGTVLMVRLALLGHLPEGMGFSVIELAVVVFLCCGLALPRGSKRPVGA